MRFANPFSSHPIDQSISENYLALALTNDQILALIWQFNQNQVEIIGFSQKNFENLDSLIHKSALAIDTAAKSAKSDVEKVVFGLSELYLQNGKPQEEIAKVLKNLATDLELDPQAYVSLGASVNHLLKIEQGITPQTVLIGIFGEFCEVHLVTNGQIKKSQSKNGEINSKTLEGLLTTLKEENQVLPSKIVVYGKPNPELQESFLHQNWGDLFIHEPKIDIISELQLAQSVAYAHAADILGGEPALGTVTVSQEKKPESPVSDLGFVEGEDVLEKAVPRRTQPQPILPQSEGQEPPLAIEQITKPPKVGKYKILSIFTKLWRLTSSKASPKKATFALLTIFLAVFLLSFIVSQFVVKAQVIIKVEGNSRQENFNAKVVAYAPNDDQKSQITGQELKGIAQGSQKAVATGSKKLGNRAKGTVNVRNWDKQTKTFALATEIITQSGLKFSLDNEITVASRSAVPGQTKVAVTAGDVGPKYNIGSGGDFTIVGFDSIFYDAVSDTEISGGDEKQVTVVAYDDLAKLEKALTDSLLIKAKDDLRAKNPDSDFSDNSLTVKIIKKDFDKKVNDEATLFNLNMEIEAQAVGYSQNDLKKLLAALVNRDAPPTLVARDEDINILDLSSKRQEGQDKTLVLSGKFQANLIPKFDEADLSYKISGKSLKEARSIVKNLQAVSDVQIKFSPDLPLFDSLPRDRNKITFSIESS